MERLLLFKDKLNAQLVLQRVNESASFLSFIEPTQEMEEVVEAIYSIKEDNKRLREDMDLVLQDLQEIKRRDMLNAILWKKPKWIEQNQKLRLEFVARQQSQNIVASSLKSIIQKGNYLAHNFTVKNVYASLIDPETSDTIFELLQNQLPTNVNLESLSKSDFITLVTGVPESLIQHALSKF